MARKQYHITLPNGETVWVSGSTVSNAMENLLMKYGNVAKPPHSTAPTVREFVDKVYRPTFIDSLRETTKCNYEQYLSVNILPFMGETKMDEVTVATIQQFYDWMATGSKHGHRNDLNSKSIERISGLASRIFKVAQEMKYISDTPFKKTLLRNNGEEAGHHVALPDAEIERVKRMIPTIPADRERAYAALLAYTGMRREEICGLRWEHVHLSEGYGEVFSTVTYPNNAKACINIGKGKTNSALRTFLIPKALAEVLQPLEQPCGYICHGRTIELPMSYSTMARTYQAVYDLLGIRGKYTNHDMRTTFGTQLIEDNMTAKSVADLMGHADTRMVETVYARARKEGILKQRSNLEALNASFTKAAGNW